MTDEFSVATIGFGWKPSNFRTKLNNERYTIDLYGWTAPPMGSVNVALKLPNIAKQQDQKATPECVAFSSEWAMTGNAFQNHAPAGSDIAIFDKKWFWGALGGSNNGAQINWAMDVLLKKNKRTSETSPNNKDIIKSYVWARTSSVVDDIRAAISAGKYCVFGTDWCDSFTSPTKNSRGEYWIALGENPRQWGPVVGGHAICLFGANDAQQCFYLINSWGMDWPEPGAGMTPIRIPYWAVNFLITKSYAELCIPTDIDPISPPNPVPATPTANFSATPVSGQVPLVVSFTDLSSGGVTMWHWDFGDGVASGEKNPVHTYTSAGTYNVSLIVANAQGNNTKTMMGFITVTDAPPSPPPADILILNSIQLTNETTGETWHKENVILDKG